jgi:hypothetical protein
MTKVKKEVMKATRIVLENLRKMEIDEGFTIAEETRVKDKIDNWACKLDAYIKVYVK